MKQKMMHSENNHSTSPHPMHLLIAFACTALLMSGCADSTGLLPDVARMIGERRQGARPESQWNYSGIWQKLADSPATYIPKGYSPSLPRTNSEGVWFEDKRDGKRLFVPNNNVGSYSPGALRGEAAKITNWKGTMKNAWRDSVSFGPR